MITITFICPMEIAYLMHHIRNGQSNLIPDDLAGVCGDIAVMIGAWERNVDSKLYGHEEALALDSNVASWIQFAENAALGSHTYILEDGPESQRVRVLMRKTEEKFWRGYTHKAAR
jgi:hypothetical protein